MDEVAEGVDTSEAAVRLSEKLGFQFTELPIIQTVHRVVRGMMTPAEAVEYLMTLPVDFEMSSLL